MTERSFSLVPFPVPDLPAIRIDGKVSLQHQQLALQFDLAGDIEQILWPAPSPDPKRIDALWQATCFEFFLAVAGRSGYWEFNMSPSGDWNVFRMDAYRRAGFREEIAILQIPFTSRREPERYGLSVSLDLSPLVRYDELLQMGITAVIQTKERNESYWALLHPAPQPDFHLRESFIVSLAGQTHPSAQSAPGG